MMTVNLPEIGDADLASWSINNPEKGEGPA